MFFYGGGDQGGKGGGVGLEGFGGVADAKDPDGEGVALADLREDLEAADGAAEDGVEVVEAVDGSEREEKFGAVVVGTAIGHGENAGGVVAEAGAEFVGKREWVTGGGVVFGPGGFGGVAALEDEAGDDAIPVEAGKKRFAVGAWGERALGAADEGGASERGAWVEKFYGEGAARGGELGVEAFGKGGGEGGGTRGLGSAKGRKEDEEGNEQRDERAFHGHDAAGLGGAGQAKAR